MEYSVNGVVIVFLFVTFCDFHLFSTNLFRDEHILGQILSRLRVTAIFQVNLGLLVSNGLLSLSLPEENL